MLETSGRRFVTVGAWAFAVLLTVRAEAQQSDAWTNELPTVEAVKARLHGTDDSDTVHTQYAAYQVLQKYIISRGWRVPAAANRNREYLAAMDQLKPALNAHKGKWFDYVRDPAFHRKVLAAFLSAPSLAIYENSETFRRDKAGHQRQTAFEASEDRQRAETPGSPERVAAVKALLAGDLRAATEAHVDRSVFGIAMGEPLNLPACPPQSSRDGLSVLAEAAQQLDRDGSMGPPEPAGTQTCQPEVDPAVALRLARPNDSQGATIVLAQVPKTKCPDWLRAGRFRCLLEVAVREGFVVAIGFHAGGERWQEAIESSLARKYGVKPAKNEVSTCKRASLGVVTQKAAVRTWSMPGLLVRYDPLGGSCDADDNVGVGRLSVEMAGRVRARNEAAARREAAQGM